MFGDIDSDMPKKLVPMWAGGLQYGVQWSRDRFDDWADNYLLNKHSRNKSALQKPQALEPRALDIGCGNGRRVKELYRLGVFSLVAASDIQMCKWFHRAANAIVDPLRHESVFVEKNVIDLEPADFDDKPFDYINFRNVAHFLSPEDFRKAIEVIACLSSKKALITMSFDGRSQAEIGSGSFRVDYLSIEDDQPNFYNDGVSIDNPKATRVRYIIESVESFLKNRGFRLLRGRELQSRRNGRPGECRIAALAPGG